jgi:hypothetical protein
MLNLEIMYTTLNHLFDVAYVGNNHQNEIVNNTIYYQGLSLHAKSPLEVTSKR